VVPSAQRSQKVEGTNRARILVASFRCPKSFERSLDYGALRAPTLGMTTSACTYARDDNEGIVAHGGPLRAIVGLRLSNVRPVIASHVRPVIASHVRPVIARLS